MNDMRSNTIESIQEVRNLLNEKQFKEMVQDAIDKFAYHNEIELYWDYQDVDVFERIVSQKLSEMDLPESQDLSFETNRQKLLYSFYENDFEFQEAFDDVINDIKVSFIKAAEEILGKDIELELADFSELLYDEFNLTTNDGIEEHLNSTDVRINLMLNYEDEWNSDFSNIDSMNSWLTGYSHGYSCETILDECDEDVQYCFQNNALSWLIYQQGYTMEDLVSGKDSPFLNSVREEMSNASNYMNELTLLLKIPVDDVLRMMSSDSPNIKISKNLSEIGIFCRWQGGGSLLEIELEKDIVISPDMISHIQFEDATRDYEYTVDQVYGLMDSCWNKGCLSFTNEPVLKDFEIDYTKVIEEREKQGNIQFMEQLKPIKCSLNEHIEDASIHHNLQDEYFDNLQDKNDFNR